jgi:hypothetical protein
MNRPRMGCSAECGGRPVAHSMAVMPKLQMSAFSLYPSAVCVITSGANQNGVPEKV